MSFIFPLSLIDSLAQYRILYSQSLFLLNSESIDSFFLVSRLAMILSTLNFNISLVNNLFPLTLGLGFSFHVLNC
jgi:hypothetical protein